MAIITRYVIGRWKIVPNIADGGMVSTPAVRLDHPAVKKVLDVTNQIARYIVDGHHCVFLVKAEEVVMANVNADPRYAVFQLRGRISLAERTKINARPGMGEPILANSDRRAAATTLTRRFRRQGGAPDRPNRDKNLPRD